MDMRIKDEFTDRLFDAILLGKQGRMLPFL